jgi:hypothetical protein
MNLNVTKTEKLLAFLLIALVFAIVFALVILFIFSVLT